MGNAGVRSRRFFPKWRATPVDERAKMLERAADIIEAALGLQPAPRIVASHG